MTDQVIPCHEDAEPYSGPRRARRRFDKRRQIIFEIDNGGLKTFRIQANVSGFNISETKASGTIYL